MKKYTVIYGKFHKIGSHTASTTHYEHIECEPKQLKEGVEKLVGWTNVWFIFDGHCEITND